MFTDVPKIQSYAKTINTTAFGGANIVKYNSPRNAYNLPSVTGKIDGGIDGVKTIMKKAFGDTVLVEKLTGDTAKKVSGTYDSFSVQIGKGGFYFRSIVSERGSLTDKDLTPAKLQLGGKTLNKQQFADAVKAGLKLSDLPGNITSLALALLELSKGSGLTIQTNSLVRNLLAATTSSDLKKFGKNYGEVIIACWCLYNKPNAVSVYFPPEEANPLADFVVNFTPASKTPPLNVSAKFEGGANASLSSIIQKNSKPPKGATDIELKSFKAVMEVAYGATIIQGLLDAEILLNTPEYQVIKKMCGGGVVILDSIAKVIEKAFDSCGIHSGMKWDVGSKGVKEKYEAFLKIMEPFYSLIPGKNAGRPDISTIPKITALPKNQYYHPVLYAFSVALAARFNSNAEFSNVLQKAATSIKAEQLYLEINNISIIIKVKKFSKSKFKFAAGAYAHKADNVRMKVALLK